MKFLLPESQRRPGFTIVELLIVIVVIAILAAITIVAYNGIQDRARSSAAAASSSQAAKKIKVWQVDNEATTPTCAQFYNLITNTSASACSFDFKDTNYQYTAGTNGAFCVTTTVVNKSYKVSESTTPTSGGCSGHGVGGIAPITNIVYNPGLVTSLSGYGSWSGGDGVVATTRQAAGWTTRGYAARATWTTSNTTTLQGLIYWQVPNGTGSTSFQQNTQYTATWKINCSKSQRLMPAVGNVQALGGLNGSATVTTNASSGAQVIAANTPTTQWVTFTTDANAVAAIVYSSVTAGTGASNWSAGDYFEIGDMTIVKGSSPISYRDGDSTDWVWNGAANNATSTGPSP